MRFVVPLLVLALSACGQSEPGRKAISDEEAIAAVEAAQNRLPPIKEIVPQPLTRADFARIEPGPACSFRPDADLAGDPLMHSGKSLAYLKIDGELIKLASDPGGPELPLGTWQHYVGKSVTLRIEWPGGAGKRVDVDRRRWPARLVLRDPIDRIAYDASGWLDCEA